MNNKPPRAANGKGSKQRPKSIPFEVYESNWARIFEKNKKEKEKQKAKEVE